MGTIAYISFNGNCEAAMNFYRDALDADELNIMYAKDAPGADSAATPPNQVMHSALMVGDGSIMGADNLPDQYEKHQGFSLSHHVKDVETGQIIFDRLSDGGKILMPFAKSFFSDGFGMIEDKFGIRWMVVVDGYPQ